MSAFKARIVSERLSRVGLAVAVAAVALTTSISGAGYAKAESASVVVAVLSSGPDSPGGGVGTSSVVLDSSGTTAYVLDYLSDQVNRVLTTSPFTVTPISLPAGSGPSDIAMSADGTFLVVSNMTNSTFSRILLSDRSVTTFSLPAGSAPRAVAVSGSYAYFAETGTSKVDKVDLATNSVVSSLTLTGAPTDIAVAPNGVFVYATSWAGGSLYKITTASLTLSDSETSLQTPVNLAVSPDSGSVYVSLNLPSNFVTYDVASGTATLRVISQSQRPISLELDNQGKFAYIGRYGGEMSKLDLTTYTATRFPLATPASNNEVGAVAFVASGSDANKYAYALNLVTSQLFRISLSPSAPTPISGVRGNSQVVVSWTTPTYPGASAITDYQIEYSTSSSGPWTSFSHTASTATTATVTGLTNGTAYYFRAAGISADGVGLYATSSAVTPATVPNAPTGVTVAPGASQQLLISWVAPIGDGGDAITDYVIETSPNVNTGPWTAVTHTASTATSITATGLTNGTPYFARVAAKNTVGTGASAVSSSSATPFVTTVPGPPRNVTGVSGSGSIAVSWLAPLSDGGSTIIDYLIEVSADGTTWTTISHSASTSTSITASGLVNGTPYLLRVAAINSVGTGAYGTGGPSTPVGGTSGGPTTSPLPSPAPTVVPTTQSAEPTVASAEASVAASVPNIGKARVIYRMLPTGKWIVVPRFRIAAKAIPAQALFTVVRSPIPGQSKNIPAARTKNAALASQHRGNAYAGVLKGKLWRGTARIIVNW
jgi:DNA-binding beta-propeller fold protein YncE